MIYILNITFELNFVKVINYFNLKNYKTFMDPLVSIIMPNFENLNYLKKSINSVIIQTLKSWELIIVDDNSSAKVTDYLKKINNCKILKIFLKKHKGAAYCRNLAIKKAKGKYIAFLDSDDVWKNNKLFTQYKFMKKNNSYFSYTDYYTFKDNIRNKKLIKVPKSFSFNQFIKNTSIGTSTMMIKNKNLNRYKFTNTKICEDYFFKCKLLKNFKIANSTLKPLTYYRIRKNSLQSSKLRNFYWIWHINKKYNKLKFLENLQSVLYISFNSLMKYGIFRD